MRPRPFKFFFGAAIAVMVLFFLARVVLAALIFAAIASTIYFIIRSLVNFFRNLTWGDEYYDYHGSYAMPGHSMDWREDILPLEDGRETGYETLKKQERIIHLR